MTGVHQHILEMIKGSPDDWVLVIVTLVAGSEEFLITALMIKQLCLQNELPKLRANDPL